MAANTSLTQPTALVRGRGSRLFSARRLTDVLMHGYVLPWLLIFVLPFLVLLDYSLQKGRGYDPIGNYSYVFLGTFRENLLLSLQVTVSAIALMPIIVALKDLPPAFEEASLCLGATRWQTFTRIVLPLIAPGISAGVLLTFVIVFNEFLVTLFVAGAGQQTAPLRVYSLIRSAGIANTTAALAVAMQAISISILLIALFFRIVGSRYLRGTYLM